MKKILLIDGNNFCYRVFWTNRSLMYNGASVSLLYGVFKHLAGLKKTYSDYCFVIVWDSKSVRRIVESKEGVEKGIIANTYKSGRLQRKEFDEQFKEMFRQIPILKEKLNLININQVYIEGYEADDVIYSYCKTLRDSEILVLTSDKDYYQMLNDNVSIYEPIKKELWTKKVFIDHFGIEPELWVDVGAISGDKSDSIEGADGWGEITALKYVKQFGTLEKILSHLTCKTDRTKKEDILTSYKDRLFLAKSLKKMDLVYPLPLLTDKKPMDKKPLHEFFIQNGFGSLILEEGRLLS